jgi:hypothetical protein
VTDKPHASPAHHTEQGHDEVPQHSPPRQIKQGNDEIPQHSPTIHTEQVARDMPEPPQQAQPIRKRGLPSEKEDEGTAEWEV